MNKRERAAELLKRLPVIYPDAHCELVYSSPLELLVATILSAQCTDKRVNMVTPALFRRCPSASDYATISQDEMEELIHSTGFYRNKSKNIRAMGAALLERHSGEVPSTLESLAALPGVGRKTANVVLGNAFSKNEGIVVDTHVSRLSQRLGLTKFTDPIRIEQDLIKLFPRPFWTDFSHCLIFHGRRRCPARKPDCAHCELNDICPSAKL
ncbi:MAG: endonuclease III [Spartobacteria bacterium]|nr:endonuclease III [Spartobacteria bacterium]